MHGGHLHQPLVAFETQLGRVVAALGMASPHRQPIDQRHRRQPLAGFHLLQQIGQVQHVGEAARAVAALQQRAGALRRLGEQQAANQRGDARPSPSLAPVAEPLLPERPAAVLGKRGKLRQRQAEQVGGKSAAQGRRPTMLRRRGQGVEQMV